MSSADMITILVLLMLLLLSAYFSATETAFSSLNAIRLKNMADSGHKRAALVLRLSDNYDQLLSTILIGNNIVNIASASLATVLFIRHLGDIGATVSTIVTTVIVLIFAEISPKSLAKESPEKFALFSAPILRVFIFLLTPLNFLFRYWKKLLSRLFKSDGDRSITEEELLTIVEEAEQEGGINEQESELIRSAIEFNDLEAGDIFTPRVDVSGIPEDATKEEAAAIFAESGYSRLPVYRDSLDNIIGVIHQKDFHNLVYHTEAPLISVIKPAVFITKSMKISQLLRLLQQRKSHLAVISDEYGGTVGIVTLEDILEELVGEIWDEHDEVIEEFQQIGDSQYRISGGANLDELFKFFHFSGEANAATVSGWVLEQLDKIPVEGDHFEYENLSVTVSKAEQRRVLEVLINRHEQQPASAASLKS